MVTANKYSVLLSATIFLHAYSRFLFHYYLYPNICSCCGKGKMITKDKLNRQNYSPPGEANKIA